LRLERRASHLVGIVAAEMAEVVAALAGRREQGERVVFTNGCFDLLHVGHLRYLREAHKFGQVLVVGVNSDASVRRLKGPQRPVVGQKERAAMVAALEPVDFVVIFEEDTPLEAIRALRPDVHVKGGDYRVEDLPEARLVQAWGGRVETIPLVLEHSTQRLIERIRRGLAADATEKS